MNQKWDAWGNLGPLYGVTTIPSPLCKCPRGVVAVSPLQQAGLQDIEIRVLFGGSEMAVEHPFVFARKTETGGVKENA